MFKAIKRLKFPPDIEPVLSKPEQLEAQAEALEREADRLEGTCWTGDISPSQARRNEAADKREHAMLLRIHRGAK